MATQGGPDHDALYHRLFGLRGVVGQLLRGFVAGPGGADIDLSDLDLDGMERLNAKFHAETGQRREGDMIWRIPRRDGADTYLVLLLEFQSSSDQYMALRVLTYAGLLWQQLVAEGRLVADGKLPPVLPVVLYNGHTRWHAPVAVRDLVDLPKPSPLWRWQPDLRYYLIDVGAFGQDDLAARDGLPALWFRLEGASSPEQVVAVADALLAWLARHPGFLEARTVFADFLRAVMARTGVDARVTEDFLDMRSMLLERAEQWQQEWLREGLEKGRQEGEAALLLRLLERRFGALPDSVSERVRSAEIASLEQWGVRVLDAGGIDDVFGESPA
jgi:hypothetical protein